MRRPPGEHRHSRDEGPVTRCAEPICPDLRGREPEWLSVSELAHSCGVSTRSLRYYEEQGLLVPERNAAGHRRYDAKAADCVHFIQCLYDAGISSDLIRTIALEWQLPDSARRIEAILRARHAELSAQLDRQRTTLGNLETVLNVVTRGG